jgi:transcriptional regulator with XRE-family HTH domain
MDKEKRARLEAAGFRIGDAEDFLELTPVERKLVETRLAFSRLVRKLREKEKVTQEELARRIESSQSRVAKIEAGAAGVSLDLVLRAVFALGGELKDVRASRHRAGVSAPGRSRQAATPPSPRQRKQRRAPAEDALVDT